jgi:UDP-N-acetylglucosamine--N-acetylmuramyl-(pentapeptide) pyrophosphoryl-undecaprenol N-acetylglucosamine transferase
MTFVIAAAGTGGHVNPALSVAEALVDRGVARSDVLFLGGERFAAEAVPKAGFPFVGFELTHLRRSMSPENLRIPVVLRRASNAMAHEIKAVGGRVVLGMSGYVTVPAAMAARRAAVPFVLQEQNAVPGLAARFASRRAGRTFLGLPGPAERLARSEVVGNPLRPALAAFDRSSLRVEARRHYEIPQTGLVVGVLGGSQGARVLNQAVAGIARADGVAAVVHLTGPGEFESVAEQALRSEVRWVCRPYEPHMEQFYAAADLVVSRAGAMTVTELAATSTPSVLVPLSRVGQLGNAEVLGSIGGAVVVKEGDVGSLPTTVASILADQRRRAAMARQLKTLHHPDAATTIAQHLIEVASG